jgi:hypothetical protein
MYSSNTLQVLPVSCIQKHTTPSPTVPNHIEAFLSNSQTAASPDSPPSRPRSALSGGSSFINDTDDEETNSDKDSVYLATSIHTHPTRRPAPKPKRYVVTIISKCILCGTSSDEVIRLAGIEYDGNREVYSTS